MKHLLAVLLTCSGLMMAKDTAIHWSSLQDVIGGKNVVLDLQGGQHVRGSNALVEMDSILLQTRKGARSVPRTSIREIRLPQSAGHKWRIIGTVIGAGVGIAIALPVLAETHNEGSSRYDGAAGGLIGALAVVGYLAGWSADKSGGRIRVLPD